MLDSKLQQCRICGNSILEEVLDLGVQELTGVFPASLEQKITSGPLRLVKCMTDAESADESNCGLLQLQHSYDLDEMYGENYGYRSGLNQSMVEHLHRKVQRIQDMVELSDGDLIVDIGSNDSTTLQAYPDKGLHLVGVDPTGTKFKEFYPPHVALIPDFFTSTVLQSKYPGERAKVVTSFSMLYDLEDPMVFMRDVYEVLADDGLWVFEQSYLPTMLEQNAYDTACHEHLEYYALHQIKWMADRVGFCIVDLEFNDINGGSFSVAVRKSASGYQHAPIVKQVLDQETGLGINTLRPYREFAARVAETKSRLVECISEINQTGQRVHALGASTKGNVLLQYCELDDSQVVSVAEVNPEKYGHFTPGSRIPIVEEKRLLEQDPDYLLVLPWHFRDFFVNSKILSGRKLIFPLPEVEVVEVP